MNVRLVTLFAFLCILTHLDGHGQMIELETQDDFHQTLDSAISRITIEGEVAQHDVQIAIKASDNISYRLDFSVTSDGTEFNRQVIDRITIRIGNKETSFTGKPVDRLLYPKLPASLIIYGLKPNGLLIEFSGPDGAESYRCQIQALPDKGATMYYQDWFGGAGGGYQKVKRIATAKFK